MKLVRGLPVRIFLAALLCAFISVPTVGLSTTEFAVIRSMEVVLDQVDRLQGHKERERCRAHPASWVGRPSDTTVIYAYDAATLRSANPEAPPIDEELAERFRNGERRPGRVLWASKFGGMMLHDLAPSGPCSLAQIMWRPAEDARRAGWRRQILVVGFLIAAAMFVTMLLAVRPFLMRLRRLQTAADGVGQETAYTSADDEVPDALGTLSTVLDSAHHRIVEQRRTLREHLANIAHDLRTPLASLQLTLEELGERLEGPERELLLNAVDETVYLDALTNNLNMASRLERVADPTEGNPKVDLVDVVEFVRSRFSVLARRHAIELSCATPETPVVVTCDAAMAQQALSNLVHNAVKYGRARGHVAVVLEVGTDWFELEVIDDGPGVASEDLERLTERALRTTEAIQRDASGSGLGLAITSAVAQRAGWRFELSAVAPSGLRARLSGPLRTPLHTS